MAICPFTVAHTFRKTNCLTEIFVERALARARELDEILHQTGQVVGPLHGLPISLKGSRRCFALYTTALVLIYIVKDQFAMKGLETIMGRFHIASISWHCLSRSQVTLRGSASTQSQIASLWKSYTNAERFHSCEPTFPKHSWYVALHLSVNHLF